MTPFTVSPTKLSAALVMGAVLLLTPGGQPGGLAVQTNAQKPAPSAVTPKSDTPWSVAFVDANAPALVVDKDSMLRGSLLVANTGSKQQAQLFVILRSARGRQVSSTSSGVEVLSGVSAQTISVTVNAEREDYPLNGVAILSESTEPTARRRELALANIALERAETLDTRLVGESAAWAFVTLLAVAYFLRRNHGSGGLTSNMGPAGSSITNGWGAALMLGAPFLTALLGFAGFPDSPHSMSKKSYLLSSLLLSSFIALAPNVYGLFRRWKIVTNAAGEKVAQNQGVVLLFLVSAWVTLTGSLGQLWLLRLMFADLGDAELISSTLSTGLVWMSNSLYWVVLVYGGVSAYSTVEWQHQLQTASSPPAEHADGMGEAAAQTIKVQQAQGEGVALPAWTPL